MCLYVYLQCSFGRLKQRSLYICGIPFRNIFPERIAANILSDNNGSGARPCCFQPIVPGIPGIYESELSLFVMAVLFVSGYLHLSHPEQAVLVRVGLSEWSVLLMGRS